MRTEGSKTDYTRRAVGSQGRAARRLVSKRVGITLAPGEIVDGDGLRGARAVQHGQRVDEMLLGEDVGDGAGDAIVLTAGTGADHELHTCCSTP